MGKGRSWPPEAVARLDYLARRQWLATFSDDAEAVVYAWTHPGTFISEYEIYGRSEFSVFRPRP